MGKDYLFVLDGSKALRSSLTRTITGRVKRWNGGDMVQRWAVAALLRAEKKFKRVKGYREIPKLIVAF